MKKYTGYTDKTPKNLLMGAGAFFKNFTVGTDTYASAVTAGKLIGATKDGGEFSAVPAVRQIEVDGIPGRAKGLAVIDGWEVFLKANVLEVSKDAIMVSLTASEVDTDTDDDYDIIKGKAEIELNDYIDNITWVGTKSGSEEPVIIQVMNALSTDGLKMTFKDKDQAAIPTTFYGYYDDDDTETPPFAIYYPKEPAPAGT